MRAAEPDYALNPWTAEFRDPVAERGYRAHGEAATDPPALRRRAG